jgi:pimeloyl-ACP methyl ester carboxylesterase
VKIFRRVGFGLFILLALGPFLVPVSTSGTLSKEEAAAEIWGEESNWIELAGHDVHYVTAGDPNSEKLIILLHGFGASAYSYKDVLEPLGEVGFVVAFDRAAFGFTERPTEWETNPYGTPGQIEVIDELIAKFGADKDVYLLGHSAGGSIAASYAVDHQDRLAGLILFAPAVLSGGGAPSWLNWLFSVPQIDHLGPLLVSSIASSGLDLLYASYFDETKVTEEVLTGYTTPLKIAGWERAFWEFNRAPKDAEVGNRLGEIDLPTLVITGDADLVVPTEDSKVVASAIAGSELVIIPQTGHLPNEESPSEFASAVVSFIGD